jgi:predicted component of type VI protein secretion system
MSGRNPPTDGVSPPSDCKFAAVNTTEAQLEQQISAAMQRMCDAPTRDEKLTHWREMRQLIDQRTPARRQFMARIRGL